MTNAAIDMSLNLTNNDNNVILLPGNAPSKNVGYQVFWRLAGNIDKEVLKTAVLKVLPEKRLPIDPGDNTYLKRSLEAIRGARSSNLVRGTGKGGYSLVHEDRKLLDLTLVSEESAYDIKLNVSIIKEEGVSRLKFVPENHPDCQKVRDEFAYQRTLFHASNDLSQWLSRKIIPLLDGVSGRDHGGFYNIVGEDNVLLLNRVMEAVHSISTFDSNGRLVNGIKIYTVPFVLSGQLVEAISDSLADETDALVDEMNDLINDNDMTLRGWAGKRRNILEMEAKLSKFSEHLGVSLASLTSKLDDIQAGIGFAEAKLAANNKPEALLITKPIGNQFVEF